MEKKAIKKILAMIMIGGMLVGLTSCKNNKQEPNETYEDYDYMVCYYGCPNSKRIKKLNTKKRRG